MNIRKASHHWIHSVNDEDFKCEVLQKSQQHPTLLLLDKGEELGRFSGSRLLRSIGDFLGTHGIHPAIG